MCEFPAVVLSDSDESEDPAVSNTSNASDTELGRLALTCRFALDCLVWGTTVEGDGYLSEGYAREDVFVAEW